MTIPTYPLYMKLKYSFYLKLLLLISCLNVTGNVKGQKVEDSMQGLKAESLVSGLSIPWDLEWMGNDQIMFTEIVGSVSVLDLTDNSVTNILELENIARELQAGLMGMALHPQFAKESKVYLTYTYYDADEAMLLCLAEYDYLASNKQLIFSKYIVKDIPAAPTNLGGRVITTSDGFIYLTVGEMEESALSQDTTRFNGKVLRYKLDGTIPKDNPINESPVYAYGLRNPQGLIEYQGTIFTSEHGTLSDDELNVITPGSNYGWPQSIGHSGEEGSWTAPIMSWTPTIAPCGISGYKGEKFPFLKDNLLIASLVDKSLRAVKLVSSKNDNTKSISVEEEKIYLSEQIGRIRDVLVTPDGRIFVASSDMDSYGMDPIDGDHIYELELKEKSQEIKLAKTPADNFLQLENTKLEIRELTTGLVHPWDMTVGPDGWIWLTEAGGFIKRVNPESSEVQLMHQFADVHETKNNPGIYSLAFHPDFKDKPYFFVHYQTEHEITKLLRFEYDLVTNTLSKRKDIIPHIIGNESHNGSRIIFTDDRKILFSVGDAYTTERSQDTSLMNGSILRINIDGTIPNDNPFPGNPIWSYGHRNPQGMAFEPNGNLYCVEHGPANDDELNRIIKGGNYGWPIIKGYPNLRSEKKKNAKDTYIQPMIAWTPTVAPNGMIYYDHPSIPEWSNSLLITFLKKGKGDIGQRLGVYHLDDRGKLTGSYEDQFVKRYGRLRAITTSSDGRIFIATSNNEKSGNGKKSIREQDDRILEIRAAH